MNTTNIPAIGQTYVEVSTGRKFTCNSYICHDPDNSTSEGGDTWRSYETEGRKYATCVISECGDILRIEKIQL